MKNLSLAFTTFVHYRLGKVVCTLLNLVDYLSDVAVYLLIRKPQNLLNSQKHHFLRADMIFRQLFFVPVISAINFYDELSFVTIEIGDKQTDGMLSPETISQLIVGQVIP